LGKEGDEEVQKGKREKKKEKKNRDLIGNNNRVGKIKFHGGRVKAEAKCHCHARESETVEQLSGWVAGDMLSYMYWSMQV
jgi:hypothetical protein